MINTKISEKSRIFFKNIFSANIVIYYVASREFYILEIFSNEFQIRENIWVLNLNNKVNSVGRQQFPLEFGRIVGCQTPLLILLACIEFIWEWVGYAGMGL